MAKNTLGKGFENRFKKDWERAFPGSICYRLPDQQSKYKNASTNPSDFWCYTEGKLLFIEAKEHRGASVPKSAMPQYDKLLKYTDREDYGIYAGFMI